MNACYPCKHTPYMQFVLKKKMKFSCTMNSTQFSIIFPNAYFTQGLHFQFIEKKP